MKPVIGITMCIDRGQRLRTGADYFYVRKAYSERIQLAGGVPLLLGVDTPPDVAAHLCDAFLLTGGDDLPSSLEGHHQRAIRSELRYPIQPAAFVAEDAERITWECQLLQEIEAAGKYALGVCYGMQLINLFHGGTLYRNLHAEHALSIDHGGGPTITHHMLDLCEESELWAGLEPHLEVNSCHRQAVKAVAPGFRVTARAPDGVVEAIERGPWFGVEWHPETHPSTSSVYANFMALVQRT